MDVVLRVLRAAVVVLGGLVGVSSGWVTYDAGLAQVMPLSHIRAGALSRGIGGSRMREDCPDDWTADGANGDVQVGGSWRGRGEDGVPFVRAGRRKARRAAGMTCVCRVLSCRSPSPDQIGSRGGREIGGVAEEMPI